MKDKLVKTHHRKSYYYLKKLGLACSIFIGTVCVVAIPVSIVTSIINYNNSVEIIKKSNAKATKEELLRY